MASFTAQKFNLSDINGGERFENGQKPQEDAFNAPIEGSAYAIELSEKAITKADQALNSIVQSGGTYPPLTAYPIGSVYISFNATSPASLFGGTWERIEDTFLLASGSSYAAGSTGGSATVTLTTAQMPRHSHDLRSVTSTTGSGIFTFAEIKSPYFTDDQYIYMSGSLAEGGDQPHNNMPPYLTVYMWKRVS